MDPRRLNVTIVGAGVGGLCLAQGLKNSGVAVEVFERDASRTSPVDGYRLSISSTGNRALKACLPDAVFERLTKHTAEPSRGLTILDYKMNRLLAIDFPNADRSSIDSEHPVSRTTLRRVLLDGLDDVVHFGKKFVSFEDMPDGRVNAWLADGSSVASDLIVGADGASSVVRSQLLPEARRIETGIVAVGGRLPLNPEVLALTPEAIMRGPTPIMGPPGCRMFWNGVRRGSLVGGEEASAAQDSGEGTGASSLEDHEEYVMWGFSARRQRFAVANKLEELDAGELKNLVVRVMAEWHPTLRRLVQMTDPSTIRPLTVKTSVPVTAWKTRNVTLLGDAIHNMPPFRGVGANAALWDAALLCETIVAVDRGTAPLLPALASYERQMLDHGFRFVRASLEDMERFHSESTISRVFARTFLRVVDRVPALQAKMVRGR
jgi:2-polyprenyl-6-methoxyphenol hydroxylase-like FAD-dependent oxidoreductase